MLYYYNICLVWNNICCKYCKIQCYYTFFAGWSNGERFHHSYSQEKIGAVIIPYLGPQENKEDFIAAILQSTQKDSALAIPKRTCADFTTAIVKSIERYICIIPTAILMDCNTALLKRR